MLINTKAITKNVKNAIKDLGMSCVITTAEGQMIRTFVVVSQKSEKDSGMSDAGQFTVISDTLYIPGDIKKAPQVGDTITFDKQTFTITEVNAVKPAAQVLVYGLQVS